MWTCYFTVGMISTLGISAVLPQTADELLAAITSIAGGVASAVTVAWLQRHWEQDEK